MKSTRLIIYCLTFLLIPILCLSQISKYEWSVHAGSTQARFDKSNPIKLGLIFESFLQYNFNNHIAIKTGFMMRRNNIVREINLYGGEYRTTGRFDYLSVPVLMKVSFGNRIKTYFQFGPYTDLYQYTKYENKLYIFLPVRYKKEFFPDKNIVLLGTIGLGVSYPIKTKLDLQLEFNSIVPSNKDEVYVFGESFLNINSTNFSFGMSYKFGFKQSVKSKKDSTQTYGKSGLNYKYKFEFVSGVTATKGNMGIPEFDPAGCTGCGYGYYFIGSLKSGIGFSAGLGISKLKLENFKYSNRFYIDYETYNYSGIANFKDANGNVCESCLPYNFKSSIVKLNYTGQFNLFKVKNSPIYFASGVSFAVFAFSNNNQYGSNEKLVKFLPFFNHSFGTLIKLNSNYLRIEPILDYQIAGQLSSRGLKLGYIF